MKLTVCILFIGIAFLSFAQDTTPTIIQPGPPTVLPYYIGQPAKAHPLSPAGVPQNPFLAAGAFSNVHNDGWMSDVYDIAGPLGNWPALLSSTLQVARQNEVPFFVCGTLTFDSHGRIVAICMGPKESSLVLVDPYTLEVLAHKKFNIAPNPAAGYGNAYMYLDNRDRAVVTQTDHFLVLEQTGPVDQPQFEVLHDYDLSQWVLPGDNIQSVMPDWQGRLWVATRHSGFIGVFEQAPDSAPGPVTPTLLGSLPLDEEIGNSFAISEDSAYVVTTKAMYRLTAGPDGTPRVVWRSQEYENINVIKPGQLTRGSGTSPTILGGGKYVAINDNAAQMHIVVYRTAADLGPKEERVVCEVPVFQEGTGATEDSIIGLDRSLIIANEYGNVLDPLEPTSSPSVPGIARVDIEPNGKGCSLAWTNNQVAAPQVGPKMSSKTGLIYFYTQKYDQTIPGYVYYWTAVDFRTGAVVWEQQVGAGPRFNSFLPGPAIGPTGALYVGLHDGIVSIRDTR
ncbi:MAG: hypothetical protein IT158_25350 [Bryobacterales bacterium]|nr:hypothetical protein [Bryobacterales bacterium]